MTLEGSLEAFSLPDIFQLLSFTKKTGALRISRAGTAGVVFFSSGSVTGASSDVSRQSLGRRLVGSGLVDDSALELAVAAVEDDPASIGLAKALHDVGAVDDGVLHEHVQEHATDAVFDLLRWTQGEFAFVADQVNPDDLGVSLVVEEVITEGRKRLEQWEKLTKTVPAPDAVVGVVLSPGADDVTVSTDEWALFALVDGHRTVSQLVRLCGRGEFATVNTLAALAERGIVSVRRKDDTDDDGIASLLRRQAVLSALEGQPEPAAAEAPAEPDPAPAATSPRGKARTSDMVEDIAADVPAVVPTRPEPLRQRTPDYPEQPVSASGARASGGSARTEGTAALAEAEPGIASLIERDPAVNKSLLLRLIAGVRGL
jgi:hypothetical protein